MQTARAPCVGLQWDWEGPRPSQPGSSLAALSSNQVASPSYTAMEPAHPAEGRGARLASELRSRGAAARAMLNEAQGLPADAPLSVALAGPLRSCCPPMDAMAEAQEQCVPVLSLRRCSCSRHKPPCSQATRGSPVPARDHQRARGRVGWRSGE
jgi:hypothetical protein